MAAKLTKEERIALEEKIWKLRIQGRQQETIAEELGVDQSTVSRTLNRIRQRAIKELDKEVKLYVVDQAKLLDHIVDESMQAWERSKNALKTLSKNKYKGSAPDNQFNSDSENVSVRDQYGDVRYLDQARSAMSDIRALLGLNAPQEVNVNNTGHYIVEVPPQMSQEEWVKRFNPSMQKQENP